MLNGMLGDFFLGGEMLWFFGGGCFEGIQWGVFFTIFLLFFLCALPIFKGQNHIEKGYFGEVEEGVTFRWSNPKNRTTFTFPSGKFMEVPSGE